MRPFLKQFTLLKGRCQAHKTGSEQQALTAASCSRSRCQVSPRACLSEPFPRLAALAPFQLVGAVGEPAPSLSPLVRTWH